MGARYWLWLLARLLAGIAIVAWAMSYMGSGSAEKELEKTLEALKAVRSFRVTATASQVETQHSDLLWEVDCQRDILHHQWHFTDSSLDPPAEVNQDEIFVSGHEFDRQKDGSWALPKNPGGFQSTKWMCRNLSQGSDINLLPQIATMIRRGILQKGDQKVVHGVACREWLVTLKGGTRGLEHDKVCIGLDDHLPYELSVDWQNSHTIISDYNAAIDFDIPQAFLEQASTTPESSETPHQ